MDFEELLLEGKEDPHVVGAADFPDKHFGLLRERI
jgi:hypothetical protein